jgi:N-acetylglucosaminyldiphosphoundecaprenol N-acetyl-beta-D-mannosaminyltransferase
VVGSDAAAGPGYAVHDVLGTPLQCTTHDLLLEFCRRRSREPGAYVVDFTNTHIVTFRRHDAAFRDATRGVDAFVPDGMPLVWLLNRRGAGLTRQVYGPSFMSHALERTPPPASHYLLGGSQACLDRLQANLAAGASAPRIAGSHHGYFGPDADEAIVEEINRLAPDFVWVGLGTPKQQEWALRNRARLTRGVVLLVGFAFDVLAGTKPDAPAWMQRHGLTWFFRLLSEPARLGPRYAKFNALFAWYLLRDGALGRPAPGRPAVGA